VDGRTLHPRFAQARLVEALSDTPVVLIHGPRATGHGPRQCGKTTLARMGGVTHGAMSTSPLTTP